MSTTVPASAADHIVLYDVSWEAYTKLLEAFADRRLRHSYSEGTLEIMSPSKPHDRWKKLIARILETICYELGIEIQSIGSTTLRKEEKEKGLEPDECYYIAHEAEVRDKPDYDPDRDPPPDLAIEVDVTHSSVDRMPIYAALGVPELWRASRDGVRFYELSPDRGYQPIPHSIAFPQLEPVVLWDTLQEITSKPETTLVHEFVERFLRVSGKNRGPS